MRVIIQRKLSITGVVGSLKRYFLGLPAHFSINSRHKSESFEAILLTFVDFLSEADKSYLSFYILLSHLFSPFSPLLAPPARSHPPLALITLSRTDSSANKVVVSSLGTLTLKHLRCGMILEVRQI